MTFIKYTNDGKAVIQPAALTLSGLEQEETLEMHTLENAIVLLKQEMEPVEKAAASLDIRSNGGHPSCSRKAKASSTKSGDPYFCGINSYS